MSTITEAIREAYASCEGDIILETVELRHPAFQEGGSPIALRFVADGVDQDLLLEADAAMNPGEVVTFISMPFGLDPPSDEEGAVPQVKFWIDNVSSEVHKHLQQAVLIRSPVFVTWREYLVGQAGPQQRVDGIELRNVKVTSLRATATAQPGNWSDRLFGKVYDRDGFPTLST
ncbi:DUF1833 family protein [Roseibium sediminicola]|uniref:DUF1833 domain-containing protein n=1 Tax=Roseibium sediminicola TaxID=2933272 RepID=A0ABT0GR87_9HYPH|nr:DUF1833 family protein [Roseibium sp. CAU 1639]MCK7611961.1 DUF1833 domain-containing protein [Roseibium sp. CAU 1639]